MYNIPKGGVFLSNDELFRELREKRALLYEIANDYYFIGRSVFENCTDEQIKLYNEFRNELSILRQNVGDLSKLTSSKVVKLSNLLKSIQEYEQFYENKNEDIATEKIYNLIIGLNKKENESLLDQINDYITAMNLSDGCFYREGEIYKEIHQNEEK